MNVLVDVFPAASVAVHVTTVLPTGKNDGEDGIHDDETTPTLSEKLGFVLCGGDLSQRTVVSEQYLLDLERKAFVELCAERKSLERLESLVKTGKILRN